MKKFTFIIYIFLISYILSKKKTPVKKTEQQIREERRRQEEERRRQEEERRRQEEERKKKEQERKKQEEERRRIEKEELKLDFEKKLSKYHSSELMTINLKANEGEYFYEEIKYKTKIEIAIFTNNQEQQFNLVISGPEKKNNKGKQIFNIIDKGYFLKIFEINEVGIYEFFIQSLNQECVISFGLKYEKIEDNALEGKSMDLLSQKLNNIKDKMNILTIKQSLVVKRTESHNHSVKQHNKSIIIFAIIEVITIALIFIFQICYIKKLLNKF